MTKYVSNKNVTVQTEATEAFAKWAEDASNRILFTSFMWKLEEDPYSPMSGALLVDVIEMMEQNKLNPTQFELDNMFSALIANDNWKRFTETIPNQYRIAAILITEMLRTTGADNEFRLAKWDVFQQLVGIENCPIPEEPATLMSEHLFGPAWAVLYAESLGPNFIKNIAIIKEANPVLISGGNQAPPSEEPPSDISM